MNDTLVKLECQKNVGIIRPEGEIIFDNSNPVKEEAKKKIRRNEVDKLIVDLRKVPYLDSSGVGFIISLFKFMRERNGELVVSSLNEKVKRVCELTRLNEIIEIFEDEEAAMEKLE